MTIMPLTRIQPNAKSGFAGISTEVWMVKWYRINTLAGIAGSSVFSLVHDRESTAGYQLRGVQGKNISQAFGCWPTVTILHYQTVYTLPAN